jgi:FkbM family methyltransferase
MKRILKFIYGVVPFKKKIFLFIKKFWTPKESIYKHLHFETPFTVKIDDSKAFKLLNGTRIENEIFWEGLTGKWEKESMKLWIELTKNSNSIFDIGANNGVYALVGKTMNPSAQVFAFEPHPVFFKNLKENVNLNGYEIELHKTAVSNINGLLNIEDYTGHTPTITVEAVTLDAFIKSNQLQNVDLLKIDVETFEPQVIEGFITALNLYKPTLLIEVLNENVAEAINNHVKDLGYLYFNIDELTGIRRTQQVEKSDFYNYLICQEDVAKRIGIL